MSRDIGDTCYVKLPQPKVNVPVYSDNIIFATGVCDYNDAYRRFVSNTYEASKAMKSRGGIVIISTCHKKHRRHNGDGAMSIESIYTRFFAFGHPGLNNVNSDVLYRKGQ